MIRLDSDIGVKTIKSIHAAVMDELDRNDELLIDFSDVERIDCSVAQLVIALGRAAKMTGKTVKLKGVQRSVKYQMQLCGIKI